MKNLIYYVKTGILKLTAAFFAAAVFVSGYAGNIPVNAQTSIYNAITDETTGLKYVIDGDSGSFSAVICGYDSAKTGPGITIPATISEVKYPVTGIYAQAFMNSNITSVAMGDGVQTIGEGAFRNCKSLTTVSFSNKIKEIPASVFDGCSALTTLTLPSSLESIGYSAFYGCSSVKTVTFPSGTLTSIGQSAFYGCSSLEKAEIPESVNNIGMSAFEGCSAMKTVTLPSALRSIDDRSFRNCSSLVGVTIPENVQIIGVSAFEGCNSLTSVTIPSKVASVRDYAFSGCKMLAGVSVPYELSDISYTAFYNSPAELFGYSGSYAESYAQRTGIIFHAQQNGHRLTFSADNYYVTVNNIAIRSSKGVLVIPPSVVSTGDVLTINVSAPDKYEINYITINGDRFTNGSNYTVGNSDVAIFASYVLKSQTTVTTPTVTAVSVTQPTTVSTTPPVSVTTPKTSTDNASPSDDLSSYVRVNSDLRDIDGVNVRIVTQRNNFISPATVRLTNTREANSAASEALESIDKENLSYYAFDISMLDLAGKENQGLMARGTITFQIPVPKQLLPYTGSLKVYHIVDGTPELIKSSIIEDIEGVKRVQFETDSFSPYMFVAETGDDEYVPVIDDESEDAFDPDDEDEDTTAKPVDFDEDPEEEDPDAVIVDDTGYSGSNRNNGSKSGIGTFNPHTGAFIAGGTICAVTLICIPLVRSRRKKRKRTRTDIE